jgi:hypothetical protein
MVKLENNYTTLERMIKPTKYERDTCPWVYDTWTCNRLKDENQSNILGVVRFRPPPYWHYAEVFVTRPMMDTTY